MYVFILNKKEWNCNHCGYVIKEIKIGRGWQPPSSTNVCRCCGTERKEHASLLSSSYPDLTELINKYIYCEFAFI